jgi:hypothetical protein
MKPSRVPNRWRSWFRSLIPKLPAGHFSSKYVLSLERELVSVHRQLLQFVITLGGVRAP